MNGKSDFPWTTGFTIDFDPASGLSKAASTSRRHLSDLEGMFVDAAGHARMVAEGDPLVYEFHELGCLEHPGDVAFGTSIVYPGMVGDEYFFTKGHFHSVLETGEVYYCLQGNGFMLIENPEGDCRALPMSRGEAVYVPRRYAHRSVNTGKDRLVTFFAFRGDAGHDYGTIRTRGFRKVLLEIDGGPRLVDHPGRVE